MPSQSIVVIIPCFNCSRYLRKTISSVIDQKYRKMEIVAIDDGSSDETRNILKTYSPRIRILSHPENLNLGQAASLNLGIKETRSDLIAFLDSDDVWAPYKLKLQSDVFYKNEDVGLVYNNGYAIDEEDRVLYRLFESGFQEPNEPAKLLLNCYIRTPSTVMVSRKIIEKAGLFKTDLQSADHDMWIRISEISRLFHLPYHLTFYRMRSGQMSSRRKQWEDGFRILREACQRYPYSNRVKRKRLATLYYRLGRHDWTNNNRLQGLIGLAFSAILDPSRAMNVCVDGAIRRGEAWGWDAGENYHIKYGVISENSVGTPNMLRKKGIHLKGNWIRMVSH